MVRAVAAGRLRSAATGRQPSNSSARPRTRHSAFGTTMNPLLPPEVLLVAGWCTWGLLASAVFTLFPLIRAWF